MPGNAVKYRRSLLTVNEAMIQERLLTRDTIALDRIGDPLSDHMVPPCLQVPSHHIRRGLLVLHLALLDLTSSLPRPNVYALVIEFLKHGSSFSYHT